MRPIKKGHAGFLPEMKSALGLGMKEWLATDEGKEATMFEFNLLSRSGEIGHS